MKVLHVINALGLGGGAEHALVQQLEPLREAGNDGEVAVLVQRGFGLEERVEEMGFTLHVLDGPGLPTRVRALRKLVRRIRPDVVHATLWDACLTSRLALLGTKVPLVNSIVNLTYDPVRVASLDVPRWKHEAVRLLDAITIRRVDRIHALSEAVADDTVRALRVKRSRITVIPRGRRGRTEAEVAEARRRIRSELGLADDVPVVITVGRQDEQKDQATLVRAFAEVLEQVPDAQLWLVGREAGQTAEIVEAIDDLDIAGSVVRFGHRDDAVDLMCAADVFAFPSRWEGLGSAVIEAMSVGLPLVVSETPAVRDLVGDFGSVVRTGETRSLAEGLIQDLRTGPRPDVSEGLRRTFGRAFSLDAVVEQTGALYQFRDSPR